MAGYAPAPTGWKDRLLGELRRDKKKTALMGVLLLVAVPLGVRAVLQSTGGAPAPVQAEAAAAAPAMPAVSAAPAVPAAAPAAPQAGAPGGAALKSLQARTEVSQDIFAVKLQYFPQEQEPNVAVAAVPATQAVDANLVRAAAVRARAKALLLQSTIISQRPQAIINGQLVGVKDTIQGFEVVEVSARSCILVQDGVRVHLDMKDE